jgi:transcriptional regulator with XRE-family HTH domain
VANITSIPHCGRTKHSVCETNVLVMLTVCYHACMEVFYRDFGRLLSNARRERGLSQERLGDRVSLSRTSIVNIEKGRQRIPLHLLVDIADALGVTPLSLLPDKVQPSQRILPRGFQGIDDEASQAWVLRQIQPEESNEEANEV